VGEGRSREGPGARQVPQGVGTLKKGVALVVC
jgi:hypothetical protein